MSEGKRTLLWAMVLAALLGLAAGWLVRMYLSPSPEGKAADKLEQIRERTREQTH
jgi:H+/Cl- antiporter ClcA